LDEPAGHLDVGARRELNSHLHRLHQAGKTLVFCTHRIGELWRLAERIIVLERGRLCADGTPEAVAGRLQGQAVVWVTVPADRTGQAAELLGQAGFTVERNGRQLWVGGPLGRRADVIQRLVAAGIPLLDFDSEAGG
jgi:ABC-type multidrug transport system ATPase subunit